MSLLESITGPADLKRLPSWFGQAEARASYGPRDIRVFAEINHVPTLSRDRVIELAGRYRDSGADVIDLGLSLGRRWLDEGPGVIAELRERGFALSIDTLDPEEILMADEAGVDYVLSLNGSNRDLAERDGVLAGFHWTKIHADEGLGEVYVVGVAPDAQGSGLGKALTTTGLAHLAAQGLPTAMLYVDADNEAARRLYDRLGFTTTRTRRVRSRTAQPSATS